jgi:hypothetical protein
MLATVAISKGGYSVSATVSSFQDNKGNCFTPLERKC